MNAPRALIATILRLFASLAALSVAPSVRKGVRKGVAFAVHYILYLDLRSIACLLHLYHPTRKLCVCLHLVQTLRRSYKNANGAQYSLCDPYPQVCLLAYLPTCLLAYLPTCLLAYPIFSYFVCCLPFPKHGSRVVLFGKPKAASSLCNSIEANGITTLSTADSE